MKVLMIGGTGQLGHFVLKHLAREGHEVAAVGIGKAPEAGFLPEGTKLVLRDTDACTVAELADMLRGVDAVIHGAGADGRNLFKEPAIDGFRAANVAPVERLVAAMRLAECRKLIILGSYYTAMARMFPGLHLAEHSPYVASRLEQDAAAKLAAGDDVSVGILELPYIFGAAPRRGTLWGFYIDTLRNGNGDVNVHAGGSACITMNQVGLAAAHLCERLEGQRNYPIGNVNLKYAQIYGIFAQHLGVQRNIVAREPSYFAETARGRVKALQDSGNEAAYDPLGMVEIEDADFFIDPLPAMQALDFGPEDIGEAIRESIEATDRFSGQGPGSR